MVVNVISRKNKCMYKKHIILYVLSDWCEIININDDLAYNC